MGDVIVSMEHITKEFPGVKALDDVKFNLRAGEVMALLGENGAGKSTLMKILSGVYSLDQGSLKIFGKDYSSLTPSSAREAGVAIIHQELNMCKDLTVAQNMFLGREERKGFVLNNSNMEDIARKYLGELGVDISSIMRIDLDKEARRLEKERRGQFPELTTCIYRVTNPAVFNRSLMQINARAMTGAVISRHKHDERISIPTAQTMLHENDYIQAVGSEEALNQLSVLVGEREEGELPLVDTQEIESLLLTKKDMINKQLGDLNPPGPAPARHKAGFCTA